MKRVGIIGTGKHGSRYAHHVVHDLDDLLLSAISRRSVEGKDQATRWSTRYFSDWRELVRDRDVDAVIAVTPPGLNLDIARECAVNGKSLLLEKPLARNSGEAKEIVKVMEESGCALTVGQTLRYNPVIRKLQEDLPTMGKLHSFAVNQRIEPSTLAWHDDPEKAGAGVVMHTAVHVFDALKVITGLRVRQVMAWARCVHSENLEDLVSILAKCDDDVIGTVDVSKVGHARSGRLEFICQDGQLHGEQIHGFTEIIKKSSVEVRSDLEQIPTILPLLQDWSAFLNGTTENPIPGVDGAYAVAVCDACLQSAKEERWVDVPG